MRRPPCAVTDPVSAGGAGPGSPLDAAVHVVRLQREIEQLREAVHSRQQIGVAVGMLAYRFRCSPEQAWSVLARISQAMNVKVREIARVLCDAQSGQLRSEDAAVLDELSRHLPVEWPAPPPAAGGGSGDG